METTTTRTALYHVATVMAYPHKNDGWCGAFRNERTKEVERQRFPDRDSARNWAKSRACAVFGAVSFAHTYRKGEYLANCWQSKVVAG